MARMEWDVTIKGCKRGFIVNVGCQQMVFTDEERAVFLGELSFLMSGDRNAPEELRRKYFPEDYNAKEQLCRTADVPPPTYVGQDCEAQPTAQNGRY